jgi:hypothetical protein
LQHVAQRRQHLLDPGFKWHYIGFRQCVSLTDAVPKACADGAERGHALTEFFMQLVRQLTPFVFLNADQARGQFPARCTGSPRKTQLPEVARSVQIRPRTVVLAFPPPRAHAVYDALAFAASMLGVACPTSRITKERRGDKIWLCTC